IYIGDRDNTLTAFRTDGTVKWRYNHGFEGDIWTSPVVGPDGTIYEVHSLNIYGSGVVTAVNPDGTEQWHYVLGVIVGTSSPAVDTNEILYVGDNYGQLHAFCTRTTVGCHGGPGTRLWRVQVGQVLSAAPTIGLDGTLYVGTSGGVVALNPTSPGCSIPCPPTQKWKFSTPGYVYQTAALSKNGTLYFGATVSNWNMFYAVDAASGALKWTYGPLSAPAAAGIFPIVGADATVYLAVGAVVIALRGTDGQFMWKFSTFNQIVSSPILGGTADPATGGQATLYVGSSDKILYAITSHRD